MKPSRFVALITLMFGCGSAPDAEVSQILELKLVGRFGSADSALTLRAIGSITLSQGRGDTLFLTQFQVPALLMLSASGDSLGMIGQAGAGPGEFVAPFTPSIQADTIWVPDLSGVISRFDDRGQFIDQFRPVLGPLGPFQHAPRFISALSDGTLLFQGISNPVGEATDKTRALALVRTDRRGAMLDTLASTAVRTSSYVLRFKDGRGIIGSHPAANPDLAAADPEGRWLAIATLELEDPARFGFTVSWIGLDGGLMAAYFVTTTPLSTEPTKHAWIEDLVSRDRVTRGQAVDAVADVPFPPYQAPAQTMFADADGRAWVSTPHASADSVRWYVVDQFSGVVGSFVLPKRVRLMAARQRSVWGWSPGAYDEPYVLKFTAEW